MMRCLALKNAKVPVEVHTYPKGGHGYGLRPSPNGVSHWPQRAGEWLQGQGWLNADSNEIYAKARVSTDEHPICPVCDMDVDKSTALKSVYKGKTYYFCSGDHKQQFDAAPEKYLSAA